LHRQCGIDQVLVRLTHTMWQPRIDLQIAFVRHPLFGQQRFANRIEESPKPELIGLLSSLGEVRSPEKRTESTRERPHTVNRCFLGKLRQFPHLLSHGFDLLASVLGGHLHEL
jgi:hypothetical protein